LSTASSSSAPGGLSFIDRVKAYGAQAMLGRLLTSDRYDRTLEGLNVVQIDISNGVVECELPIDVRHANTYGSLHGGCSATIVDVVGTMALLTKDPLRPGVSVDLNVTYLAAAKLGETVRIVGKVLKSGKRLGFTEVSITSKDG
jgi:acyl-coenzyme A thioesterase 13